MARVPGGTKPVAPTTEETSSVATALQDIITGIFHDEFRVEPFSLRRSSSPATDTVDRPPSSATATPTAEQQSSPKRRKLEARPASAVITTTSEVLRHVTQFLNPKELAVWSSTCKSSRRASLDAMFDFFRIPKVETDGLQEALMHRQQKQEPPHMVVTTWTAVLHILLHAAHELQHNIYGPYRVHALHAALVGATIVYELQRQDMSIVGRYSGATSSSMHTGPRLGRLWSLISGNWHLQAVCGKYGDYFWPTGTDNVGVKEFWNRVTSDPTRIPSGPGRVLAEDGRLPYINVLCHEADEETCQYGFSFQRQPEGENELPYVLFAMEHDNLPHSDDEYEDVPNEPFYCGVDAERGLEQGTVPLFRGSDHADVSLEQAFCQFNLVEDKEVVDGWTQALRAMWMYEHSIPPFDQATPQGPAKWEKIRRLIKADSTAASPYVHSEHADMVQECIFGCDGEEDEELGREEMLVLMQRNHGRAKASTYW